MRMSTASAFGARIVVLLTWLICMPQGWAEIWQDSEPAAKGLGPAFQARTLSADEATLRQRLAAAPLEATASQGAELVLPLPDGSLQRFEVEYSPVMAPELAARYPQIRTYRARGLDDPHTRGCLDMTSAGFHAMLSSPGGTVLINPDGSGGYLSYHARDYRLAARGTTADTTLPGCLVDESLQSVARPLDDYALRSSGSRRIYRLAVAATGEYTAFHGGSVEAALAEMVTAINRVNEIYGRDLAVQFVLVFNNDRIIYTDAATDPYTNDDGTTMLTENQQNLDAVIGTDNYDVGHVFSTGGGGIAQVGGGCLAGVKARGVTGQPEPVGDIFYIDLVAHELGHQLNAVHSFNGTTLQCGVQGNRVGDSAVEPGSGSTIMAYAGLCGEENLQPHTDAVFHAQSMQEIVAFTTTGAGATCGATVSTGNTAPSVNAGIDYIIPSETPFALTGGASDADADALSYQWDEMDAGGDNFATDAATFGTDLQENPLFRSYMPVNGPVRIFPRFSDLLANDQNPAEVLPRFQRVMNFRLTARDGESGVGEDDMQVQVIEKAVPFAIIDPIISGLVPGQRLPIKWNVAETHLTPINCTTVDIHLLAFSSDKSQYCEYELASNVPNNGDFSLPVPNDYGTGSGRIRVKCSNNIFFDVNNSDIAINDDVRLGTSCMQTDGTLLLHGTVFNDAGDSITTSPPSGDDGGSGGLSWLALLLGIAWSLRHGRRARAL